MYINRHLAVFSPDCAILLYWLWISGNLISENLKWDYKVYTSIFLNDNLTYLTDSTCTSDIVISIY